MTTMEKIKKIRGILDNFEERLLDREDDLKEEVRENIKSEIEDMGDDSDLLDFVNEHCGATVYQSGNTLEDFVNVEELITELIDRNEDLGNSTIRDELDKLNNPDDEIEREFLDELKTALGIEEEKKEVKQDSNEDFKKVIDWIYEHKMLGEDFDNKFPNLANKYKEKEC